MKNILLSVLSVFSIVLTVFVYLLWNNHNFIDKQRKSSITLTNYEIYEMWDIREDYYDYDKGFIIYEKSLADDIIAYCNSNRDIRFIRDVLTDKKHFSCSLYMIAKWININANNNYSCSIRDLIYANLLSDLEKKPISDAERSGAIRRDHMRHRLEAKHRNDSNFVYNDNQDLDSLVIVDRKRYLQYIYDGI